MKCICSFQMRKLKECTWTQQAYRMEGREARVLPLRRRRHAHVA